MFSPSCYVFEPPNPIKKSYYRCDKIFHLDDLLELYKVYDTYAIVLISGKRTDIYSYSKNNINLIKKIKSDLPSQFKTGGSSAPRLGRIRDEKINLHIKQMSELMVKFLVKDNLFQHQGLILAGPAQLKDQIQTEQIFQQFFSPHLIQTITIAEITDQSINYVVSVVAAASKPVDSDAVEKFESILSDVQLIDLIVFGEADVLKELADGNLEELFVHADIIDSVGLTDLSIKTIVHIITNKQFAQKYGQLVGIKYYHTDIEEI